MGINIGGILGGIAGLLVPGAGTFLAPAIGAGLGTLAGGGSFKNAIKYGLLAGGANTAFGGGIGKYSRNIKLNILIVQISFKAQSLINFVPYNQPVFMCYYHN